MNIADLFGLGGGASGERDGSRKVTFLDDAALESTVEYAPTPTKRNPGVGKTAAKLAPFGGGGASTATSEGDLLEPGLQSAAHRALRHAAGRWVIPPQELKLGCRIGSGSFGQVFTADWNGTEVALKQMHDKSLTGSTVQEFSDEIRVMQGLRHPNVVLFLGAVIQSPTLSIVCELMPLGSLHSLLHGKSRGGVELSSNGRLRRDGAGLRERDELPALAVSSGGASRSQTRQLAGGLSLDAEGFGFRDVSAKAQHLPEQQLSRRNPGVDGARSPSKRPHGRELGRLLLRRDPMGAHDAQVPVGGALSPVQIVVQVAFLHRRGIAPRGCPRRRCSCCNSAGTRTRRRDRSSQRF